MIAAPVASFSPALDGLRGIAILLVVVHHLTILEPTTPVEAWLVKIALIGWAGVDLFFVLSGFLITGILIDARGSERYFTSFYARRTLRIFPLYYTIIVVSFVILPRLPYWYDLLIGPGAPTDPWPYVLYLTNFALADRDRFLHGILDVAWSLAIEEQFYLVWAAVVWLCPPRALGWLCAALMVAAPVARSLAVGRGADDIDLYVLPLFRADALATGALLAWLARHNALAGRGALAGRVAIMGGVAIAAVCWRDGDSLWWHPTMQRVGYTVLAVTAAGMLVSALVLPNSSWWPRLLRSGWLRAFGKYSYCLYLIHLPVMRVVRTFALPADSFAAFGSPLVGQLAFYVLATAPALVIAWVSWHVLEAPMLRLKSRFTY